jgi:hypothetical protein
MREVSEFFRRQYTPERGLCFVLMPFEEAMSAVYEHGIKPLVEAQGMRCRRADEMYTAQGILGDIWQSIQSAEIVIADLTGKNPNVMYELGLCHALWKRVILLSQNKDDVPFDLRAWRVLWYDFTFAGAARLKDELKRAIDSMKGESATESDIVPLRTGPAEAIHTPSEWITGIVDTWRGEYGFITAGDERFFFSPDLFFAPGTKVEVGQRATFTPMEPSRPGTRRRAGRLFVADSVVCARITKVVAAKGYGFGDVAGQHNQTHSLLVLIPPEVHVAEGTEVECVVDSNAKGPVGRIVTGRPCGSAC